MTVHTSAWREQGWVGFFVDGKALPTSPEAGHAELNYARLSHPHPALASVPGWRSDLVWVPVWL